MNNGKHIVMIDDRPLRVTQTEKLRIEDNMKKRAANDRQVQEQIRAARVGPRPVNSNLSSWLGRSPKRTQDELVYSV